MPEMSPKLPLFFEFYELKIGGAKSEKVSIRQLPDVNLFMMSKNEKEQNLGWQSRRDTTLRK